MRVVIEIENSYGEPVELFPPHQDDYYEFNHVEVQVSPFVREFEGLDLDEEEIWNMPGAGTLLSSQIGIVG